MKSFSYRVKPTKRVEIPKSNGGTRMLGIPSIQDKIIQCIMKKILQCIFDKKFSKYSHGYRPNKGVHTVAKNLRE